ncbi:MAG: sorbosone dehydrogenase family protein [Gammaproteobacteria bacterium]|nr:sorbosone dehydrogenase family protein [Gammaproteobacteria bacterium]
MPLSRRVLPVLCLLALVTGCRESATLPLDAGTGADPTLPKPVKQLIPTVDIAPAVGWSAGQSPTPVAGLQVTAFATQLDHPRWLLVLPNGDVLVAESNAPARPDDGKGVKGMVTKAVMKRAGAGVPSANRISLLRDANGDGVAEFRSVFAENLNSPFGMALVDGDLYVANTDGIVHFAYRDGMTRVAGAGTKLAELPAGPINHHWTKSLIASPDGKKLYVTVGSNSNVGENGMEKETQRAAIHEIDRATGAGRVFASGLRNPNGMDWEPRSGKLWTAVNERDELGSDLVPDYMTSVQDGAFYGWPYSYYGQHVDARVDPPRPDLVAKAIAPDYALGAHVAPLGLVFSRAAASLPARYAEGVFIGQHGSWNRRPPSGYRVVFVPFSGGRPSGPVQEVLAGFLDAKGNARGRPVGVAIDRRGALLVADDVGNSIWRVSAAAPAR